MRKVTNIWKAYDANKTHKDGVVIAVETEDGNTINCEISGTEWVTRYVEKDFNVCGVLLTKDQIQEINHLLNPNAD